MEDTINALDVKKSKVKLNGKEYDVKSITIGQLFKLMGLLKNNISEIQAEIKPETKDSDLFWIIFAKVEEKGLLKEALGIILVSDFSDDDFISIPITDISDLATTLLEVNDFKKIFSNFQMAKLNLKK